MFDGRQLPEDMCWDDVVYAWYWLWGQLCDVIDQVTLFTVGMEG